MARYENNMARYENHGGPGTLTLNDLARANAARQDEWCVGGNGRPDLSYRGNELAGETGEACNVIKKLERERHGWRGSRATVDQLAQELADVVICADLCATEAGVDLSQAVVDKFNADSDKIGLKTKLSALQAPTAGAAVAGVAGDLDGLSARTRAWMRYAETAGADSCFQGAFNSGWIAAEQDARLTPAAPRSADLPGREEIARKAAVLREEAKTLEGVGSYTSADQARAVAEAYEESLALFDNKSPSSGAETRADE